jgi:hypothetical protein
MAVATSSYPPELDAHIWRGFRFVEGQIKLGIALRRTDQAPQWVARLLNLMIAEPALKLDVVYRLKGTEWPERKTEGLARGDAQDSPFTEVPIAAKPACCFVEVDYRNGIGFTEQARAKIAKRNLDVLLWLDWFPPAGGSSGLAKGGVWQFRFGRPAEPIHDPPYWREVAEGKPVSEVALIRHTACFAEGELIASHQAPTQANLVKTAEQPAAMTVPLLFRALLDLLSGALPPGQRVTPSSQIVPGGTAKLPSFGRRVVQNWKARRQQQTPPVWRIGVRNNAGAGFQATQHPAFAEVPQPRGSSYAQPFLFAHQQRLFLFFRETTAALQGRICALEIAENLRFGTPFVALEQTNPISYPFLFRDGGEIYLVPECASKFSVPLYRAKRFPVEWEHVANLVEGLPLVNSTLFHANDAWYLFTSTEEPGVETMLLYSDRLEGAWHYHPRNPVSSDCRRARPAGALFQHEGQLIRPTQDCSARPHHPIALNRITRLSTAEYAEEPAGVIDPQWRPGLTATQTWSSTGSYQAIDGLLLGR